MKKANYVNKNNNKKQSIIITLVTAFLCLLIIVISGIYTKMEPDSYDVSGEETIPVNYESDDATKKIDKKQEISEPEESIAEDTDTQTYEIAKTFEFIMPIKYEGSEIQKIFSLDALIYSISMEDYRIHNGIDIACPIGTQVYCAEDGVVTRAQEDVFTGYTIEIEHGEEYKTVYSNLSSVDMVEVGQNVKKNEILATTGQTAPTEILDAPHLHFSILKNGEYINPLEIIN